MRLSAVVAVSKNGVIGREGGLPWYLPAELARFKEITTGHPIIMGRTTHESIGRPLPNRTNIVISRDKTLKVEGYEVANSLEQAIDLASRAPGSDEVFIIGGQSIYELSMKFLDRLYLTRVDADISGDKYFNYDPKAWKKIESEKRPKDEKNPYSFEFITLDRL